MQKIWFEKNCTIAVHNAIVRMSSYVMASYQCYHCQAILEPTRVENEGRPFYSVSKDDFMQYTKETYPDIFHMTCEPKKEIIPFRPVVVEQSKENVAPVTGDDKVEMVED